MKELTFFTSMSKSEIIAVLLDWIGPASGDRYFLGEVYEDEFYLARYQPFSNNVLNPCIEGTMTETESGTNIEIRVRVKKSDIVGFSVLFSLFFGVLLIMFLTGDSKNVFDFIAVILVVACFVSACIGLCYVIFTAKAKKALAKVKQYLLR